MLLIGGVNTNGKWIRETETFDCLGKRGDRLAPSELQPKLNSKRKNLSSIVLEDRYLFVFCGKSFKIEETFSTSLEWADLLAPKCEFKEIEINQAKFLCQPLIMLEETTEDDFKLLLFGGQEDSNDIDSVKRLRLDRKAGFEASITKTVPHSNNHRRYRFRQNATVFGTAWLPTNSQARLQPTHVCGDLADQSKSPVVFEVTSHDVKNARILFDWSRHVHN